MRFRKAAPLLLILVVSSLVYAFAYGKLGKSKPLKISFAGKPVKEIDQDTVYTLQTIWENKEKQLKVEGCFIFSVTSKKAEITQSDLLFSFNGSTILPIEQNGALIYQLPSQTFPAQETGVLSVEIIYHKSGGYTWEIGVIEIP